MLTDSEPAPIATTTDPRYVEKVNNLTEAMKWVFKDQGLMNILPIVNRNSLISGPGYIFADWEESDDGGDGQIKLEVINWQNVWLDGKTPFIGKCFKAIMSRSAWGRIASLIVTGKQSNPTR